MVRETYREVLVAALEVGETGCDVTDEMHMILVKRFVLHIVLLSQCNHSVASKFWGEMRLEVASFLIPWA